MSTPIKARDAHVLAQLANGYYDRFLPKIFGIIKNAAERGDFGVLIVRNAVIDVELDRSETVTIEQGIADKLKSLGYEVVDHRDSLRRDKFLFEVKWRDL